MSHRHARLLIRAEAGAEIGAGHVMRCLALAQAAVDEGAAATFLLPRDVPALADRLRGEGCGVETTPAAPGALADAGATLTAAQRTGATHLVADGYALGAAWQLALRPAGLRTLLIDDGISSEPIHADLVLNQNAYATPGMYAGRTADAQLLLGPACALLRREFRAVPRRAEPAPQARRVLLTLGGGQHAGTLERLLLALGEVSGELEVCLLAGLMGSQAARLGDIAGGMPHRVRFEPHAADITAWMTWADVALSGGGSTCYELARCGVPALVVELAENQRPLAAALQAGGTLESLGWHADLDPSRAARHIAALLADAPRRRAMSTAGQALVDGLGAGRVAAALLGHR